MCWTLVGGIQIAHDRGCVAHSDGDVLLHCVVDAITGRAVHVETSVESDGFQLLKLKCDKLLSSCTFNFNLRHCSLGYDGTPPGSYRAVGRCRLTVSKSALKAPMVSALETKM